MDGTEGGTDASDASDASDGETCGCKVGRLIDEYGFESTNDELALRWTKGGREDASVRELTDDLNRRILRAEMERAGGEFFDDEVASIYRHLAADDANKGMETQARNRLARHDIDVEELETRFVSHQSVYRHLRECLALTKDRGATPEKETERIHRMQNRSEAVLTDSLRRLRERDQVAVDEFDVLVNFRVMCEECGSLYDVTEFLDEGGCRCQRS